MNLNESFLLKMQNATRAELENEFAEFPAFMAVVNNDMDAAMSIDTDDFLYAELFECTPADLCVVLQRYEMLEQLSFRDASFITFVSRALARFGTSEAVRFVHRANFLNEERIHYSIKNPDTTMLEFIMGGFDFSELLTKKFMEMIETAIVCNNLLFLRNLLHKKSRTFLPFFAANSTRIFCEAARNGSEEMVIFFIEMGADINMKKYEPYLPIECACLNPNEKVVQLLLSHGAKHGKRMLSMAARNKNEKVMQTLLDAGVEGLETIVSGFTPLADAVDGGTAVVVRVLLGAGASLLTYSPRRLLYYAATNKDSGVMRTLLDAGVDLGTDFEREGLLSAASRVGNKEVFFMLWNAGCRLPDVDEEHWYILSPFIEEATRGNCVDIFRFLYNQIENKTIRENIARVFSVWQGTLRVSPENMVELFARGAQKTVLTAKSENTDFIETKVLSFIAGGCHPQDETFHPLFDLSAWYRRARCFVDFASRVYNGIEERDFPTGRWVRRQVAERQFVLLRARAVHICTVLRDVTALEQCEVLSNIFAPMPCLVPFHKIWRVVRFIKHFKP